MGANTAAATSRRNAGETCQSATSQPLTTANIRHALGWKGHKALHQLQGKPIRLRFHLKNARMFSLTPRTQKVHYIRSYD